MAGLLVLASTAAARAQGETADALIEQGLRAREAGDDHSALVHFQSAVTLQRTGRGLFQLGQVELALGLLVDAEGHLEEAQGTRDPWIETPHVRSALEQSLGTLRARLGTLEVWSNVDGAEVRVDNEARGTLPLARSLRVRAGTVGVEIQAEGHMPIRRSVEVRAGQTTRERFPLVLDPDPDRTQEGADEAGDGDVDFTDDDATESIVAGGDGVTPASSSPGFEPVEGRVGTLIALGIGVASLVGGSVVWFDGVNVYDELSADCGLSSGCDETLVAASGLEERGIAATTLMVVAGVAALTAIVLYLVEGLRSAPESTERTSGRVRWRWSF